MESVVFVAKSLEELERDVQSTFGVFQTVRTILPGSFQSGKPERIRAGAAERMPIHHRETQPLFHGAAQNYLKMLGLIFSIQHSSIRIGTPLRKGQMNFRLLDLQ